MELNIFNTEHRDNQPIRQQIYATRFYLFLLTSTFMVLSAYTLLSQSVYRQTVLNPSESEYLQLEQAYPNSLSCPCNFINMSYSTFITSKPHYHQLCSSDLMTARWLRYTSSTSGSVSFLYDYRFYGVTQFQTLAFFCEFARRTVDDARDTFHRKERVE